MDVWLGTSKSPKQSIAKSLELIKKAIELDPTNAEAYGHLGFTFSMMGEPEKAVANAEKAVALNPNSAYNHMRLGHTLRFAGRNKESEHAKGLNDAANINLSNEFAEILSPGGYGMVN